MSTATGGRADLLIADDVVDQRNALLMPRLREAVKKAWFSNWVQLLQPTGGSSTSVRCGTDSDLSHALLENSAFQKLRYAVGEHGEAIWPEIWSQGRLLERCEEIGLMEFSRAYRNIPQDESYAPVHPDWIQYEEVGKLTTDDVEFVLSYDLAIGDSENSDYFGAVVLAVQENARKAYVVDAWRARLSAPEQVKRIVEDAKRWENATCWSRVLRTNRH